MVPCNCRLLVQIIFPCHFLSFYWQDPRWISSLMAGCKDVRLTFQLDGVSWFWMILHHIYFWTIDCQITVSIAAWLFCLLMFIMTRCTCLSRIQRDFAPNGLMGKLCFFRPKPCTTESQQAEPDKYHWIINVKPSCFTIGLSCFEKMLCVNYVRVVHLESKTKLFHGNHWRRYRARCHRIFNSVCELFDTCGDQALKKGLGCEMRFWNMEYSSYFLEYGDLWELELSHVINTLCTYYITYHIHYIYIQNPGHWYDFAKYVWICIAAWNINKFDHRHGSQACVFCFQAMQIINCN